MVSTTAFSDPESGVTGEAVRPPEIVSVAVLKKGNKAENGEEQVDAVSGATITSTGVSDMLRANLAEYAEFLNQLNEEKEVEDVVTED